MPIIKNQAVIDRNCFRIYGCGHSEALQLNQGKPLRERGSIALAYAVQRQSAKARGISWEMTFPEWIATWTESGVFNKRGVGIGSYCMARNGDTGPYHVDNVQIQLCTINSRDGLATRFSRQADFSHGSNHLFLPEACHSERFRINRKGS